MDRQTITLMLLAICVIPIAVLVVFAIFKLVRNRRQLRKAHNEIEEAEGVDLEQRMIFYEAYGGEENILEIKLEMNRITVTVQDIDKVNGERLKELGATGVLLVGNLVKASYSDRAKYVYKLMEK